jgi:hypothetical protein
VPTDQPPGPAKVDVVFDTGPLAGVLRVSAEVRIAPAR